MCKNVFSWLPEMGLLDPQMRPGSHFSSPKIETGLRGLIFCLFFASREWQKTQSKNEGEEHFEKNSILPCAPILMEGANSYITML